MVPLFGLRHQKPSHLVASTDLLASKATDAKVPNFMPTKA